ncbi:MAG: FG-GAP repeat domain-containing protein [Rhodobacterales bacterium]
MRNRNDTRHPCHAQQVGLRLGLMALCLSVAATAMAEPVAPLSARFTEPTNRYPHNVLGDLPGFGALEVSVAGNKTLLLRLSEARVFEDIAPRLWDIDGDGIPEIVAVESDQRQGARLTAWQVQQGADGTLSLTLRAADDFIGTRFRWLALAGIGDFTGDGLPEIAYVEMPHLARRMVLVGLAGERFVPLARLGGVSNHRIGENFITGGVRDCGRGPQGAGPQILVPSSDWGRVLRITLQNGQLNAVDAGPFAGASALEARLRCAE